MAVWALLSLFVVKLAAQNYGSYSVQTTHSNDYGIHADLAWTNGPDPSPFDPAFAAINVDVYYVTPNTLRIKLTTDSPRWEVPGIVRENGTTNAARDYNVEIESPFKLRVIRTTTNEVIFESNSLYYSERYLQWGTLLDLNSNIYGLGERVWPLRFDHLSPETFSFLNSDLGGSPEKLPLYGAHPFFMNNINGSAYGVFLLNSNVMDVALGESTLTYKTTGGILDVFIFTGPTPQAVTLQYHNTIGRPYMPPLWGLGYHQCRWGYDSYTDLQAVIDQMDANQVPVDTFWVDIDYMQGWRVWTTDPTLWPRQQFGDLVRSLHSTGRHFVPIIDPGVKLDFDGYGPLADGINRNVFVKSPVGDDFTIGKVWPGRVYFPDWTHPNASDYWEYWTRNFYNDIPIDGVWIDMNEAASFCDGRCLEGPEEDDTYADDYSLFACNCSEDMRLNTTYYDEPPYIPVDAYNRPPRAISPPSFHGLDISTISFAAPHYLTLEYNIHNLYGHFESILSNGIMSRVRGLRPFIITRSSFPGTGAYVGHWLGDNYSQWSYMRYSIAGAINFGLFGIPLVGADICGFMGNTTAEMCQRWMQVGAFYPFSRNHNQEGMISQEPYAFGEEILESNKQILFTRYSLLPYYYTLFYQAHIMGGAVFRGLFYEFPTEAATYALDEQFMIGSGLLVSPVLYENKTSVLAYFPHAVWYDYFDGHEVINDSEEERVLNLSAPLDTIPVHLRGGTILPIQTPGLNTVAQKANPYKLLIALNEPAHHANQSNMCMCDDFSVPDSYFEPCNQCLLGDDCSSCCSFLSDFVNLPCFSYWLEHSGAQYYGLTQYALPTCNFQLVDECGSMLMATGSLYLDDGEQLDTVENGYFALHYYSVMMKHDGGFTLSGYLLMNESVTTNGLIIDEINIYGQDKSGCSGEMSVSFLGGNSLGKTHSHNHNGSVFGMIEGLSLSLSQNLQLDFTCSSSSSSGLKTADIVIIVVLVVVVVGAIATYLIYRRRNKRTREEGMYLRQQDDGSSYH